MKRKPAHAKRVVTVVRMAQPDLDRQTRALLRLLEISTKENRRDAPGVGAWGENKTQREDNFNGSV